ncbi:MAG: hypothetical protein ABI380_06545 [Edaphobacter sp.]
MASASIHNATTRGRLHGAVAICGREVEAQDGEKENSLMDGPSGLADASAV